MKKTDFSKFMTAYAPLTETSFLCACEVNLKKKRYLCKIIQLNK